MLPALPPGLRWSGIGRTVFAVPTSFVMWPGDYCGTDLGRGLVDGHDRLDITRWNVTVACPAEMVQDPPIPAGDGIDLRADAHGTVHLSLALPRAIPGLSTRSVARSRLTLPAGWWAVPAGEPSGGVGPPTLTSEIAALKAAGFRTRITRVSGWGDSPRITTRPEIGAPARRGSLVTVVEATSPQARPRLRGRLMAVGGPAPGAPRPVTGWVHVRGGRLDEYAATDARGRWSIAVRAGTAYTITGAFRSTPVGAPDESCRTHARVTLRIAQPARARLRVLCPVK